MAFKTRQIEQIILEKGFERGIKFVVEAQNETIRELRKSITEMAQQQMQMIDTMANVVNGAGAMKAEFEKQMKKAGLVEPQDDMGPNTQDLN